LKNTEIKIGSNKSFGIVFFLVFLLIAIYPLINYEGLRIWSFIISIIFLFLGLINSKFLTPFNKLWFKFGLLLGRIVSPVIIGIIFFFVVTPTAFIMRIIRKDLLNLKFNNKKTYWIEKTGPKSKMKNQF
tara:strand:+ start:551 stop:940 length:390 start_codon:yes stop_codon:yes gene_type:complete